VIILSLTELALDEDYIWRFNSIAFLLVVFSITTNDEELVFLGLPCSSQTIYEETKLSLSFSYLLFSV